MAETPSTILYVDDDRYICDVVTRILSLAGYDVLTAKDAEQALRVLAVVQIDAMITDIIMPGRHGVALAEEAKRRRPGLKIMFMTGYAQRAAEHQAMRLGRTLLKPVRAPELVSAVKALLPA